MHRFEYCGPVVKVHLIEVGKHQFQIEHLGVTQRVDRASRMGHRWIVENAQDMRQRIYFTQRRKHAGIFRAVFHHPAEVDIFDGSVGDLFRVV